MGALAQRIGDEKHAVERASRAAYDARRGRGPLFDKRGDITRAKYNT
jgi:hypothetical protein